jgi:Tfp pilus assembly protein PilN
MTVQVNLLPPEYHWRARRGRRLRMWLTLCAAAVVGQAVLAAAVHYLAGETELRIAQVVDMRNDEQALIKQLAALRAEHQATRRRVILAEQLQSKHRWSRTLGDLVEAVPQTAMLTRLQTIPPRAEAPKPRKKQPERLTVLGERPQKPPGESVARGFMIDGLAADHESVAGLLRRLNETRRLGTCELLSTRQQPFRNGHAVALSIRSEWP